MAGLKNSGVSGLAAALEDAYTGQQMLLFAEEIFPFHRSITGAGVRETFSALQRRIPLSVTGVASGTNVFDWIVPQEWVIRDAYVKDASGRRVIDYRASNLHVVSYSRPIHQTLPWEQLLPHLHTLPDRPDWIPYRTSHFSEQWGFCLRHHELERLEARQEESYEVCIDSEFIDGELLYGECVLPGKRDEEILISTHVCHPSLANDNVAALVVAATLARQLAQIADREWTYRFLFVPATIGAITWLFVNQRLVQRVRAGLVLSTMGDAGGLTYKCSRRGNSIIDRVVPEVLARSGRRFQVREFVPFGYDERQFCSPGFNLPIGCLMRTPNGEYPEYHTSADNLDLLSAGAMLDSLDALRLIVLSSDLRDAAPSERQSWPGDRQTETESGLSRSFPQAGHRFLNQHPQCEPPLGEFGLYQTYGQTANPDFQRAVLWLLNFSDGEHDLLAICSRSGIAVAVMLEAASRLCQCGLLRIID